MSFRRRTRLAIAALTTAITMGASLTVMSPANAYAPGTISAHMYYVNDTPYGPQYKYYCNLDHWRSGAKVTYSCDLYFREWILGVGWREYLSTKHSGSWTPPPASRTTSTWSQAVQIGGPQFCVHAKALSVDGGTTDTYCFV